MMRLSCLLAAIVVLSLGQQVITITHTNDFHGYLQPASSNSVNNGGAARMLFCEKYWRAKTDDSLVLDAGDVMFGGQPISYLANGSSTIEFFNLRGVHAVVVGNHDFDRGQDTLMKLVDQSNFTWLGANVVKEGTNWTQPSFLQPFAVFTMPTTGVRIGVIGITVPYCKKISFPDNTAGLTFKDGTDAIEYFYPEVKATSDVVVVLAHLGSTTFTTRDGVTYDGTPQVAAKLAARKIAVDLIISGHDHKLMMYTKVNDTLVVDGESHNKRLGIALLQWDNETDSANLSSTHLLQVKNESDANCPQGRDAAATTLISKWAASVTGKLATLIGNTTVSLKKSQNWLGESTMGKLVTDSFRYWGDLTDDGVLNNSTNVAFINGDEIYSSITLKGKKRSFTNIVWSNMTSVLPLSNNMVICSIPGKQMLQICSAMMGYFNVSSSGISLSWVFSTAQDGSTTNTLESCFVNGKPVNTSATYRVTTVSSMIDGSGDMGLLADVTDVVYYNELDIDAVAKYFSEHFIESPITNESYPGDRGTNRSAETSASAPTQSTTPDGPESDHKSSEQISPSPMESSDLPVSAAGILVPAMSLLLAALLL